MIEVDDLVARAGELLAELMDVRDRYLAALLWRFYANGQFVTAGSQPLMASSASNGTDQQFDVLDAGGGNLALRAHANSMLVTAENAGAASLVANRTAIGPWETFQLLHNADGSVSLRALVNNMLVTSENAGSSALIANRTAVGPWEEFDLINNN